MLAEYAGRVSIVGEVSLEIHHGLIGLQGATLDGIRTVLSHPVALAQCIKNIAKLPGAPKTKEESDTAGSLDVILDIGDKSNAAVASVRGLETRSGLQVLAHGFEDDSTNTTRFAVLQAGGPRTISGANKTSLFVTRHDTDETLPDIIQMSSALARIGIKQARMHDLTMQGRPFDPAYLVDYAGDVQTSARFRSAVNAGRVRGLDIQLLGSYVKGPKINP